MQESIKRVPLPAVVFNRTPNKQRRQTSTSNNKLYAVVTPTRNSVSPSLNSSKRQQILEEKENSRMGNSRIQGQTCMNHQFKEATYSVVGECGKYCEKCAILLASQGFKVKKAVVVSPYVNKQRKHQIDSLNSVVNQTLRMLGTKKVQTNQCQIHCQQTFQQQISIAQQYFQELHKVINYYQQQTLQYIQNQFNQSQRIQQQLKQIIQQSLTQTTNIKSSISYPDLLSSHQIDSNQFINTLQLYKLKLNSYKKMSKSWRAEDIVMRGINLCDINHVDKIFQDLYKKEIILFESNDSCNMRKQYQGRYNSTWIRDDGVIEEQETINEDDIQI